LVVGQAIPPSAGVPDGNEGVVHVLPPSEETTKCPENGCPVSGVTPVAAHDDVVMHDTPRSVTLATGGACFAHVVPPSLDETMTPWPTATQCFESPQETESSVPTPEGSVRFDQVTPLSELSDATAFPLLSAPTATQKLAEVQSIPLNDPWPGVEPPEVPTTGAELSV
jgi:hypothetical protein